MKVLFVNYISNNTPSELLEDYHRQHRIFVTSALIKQRDGIASLIKGDVKKAFFVEGLELLKEAKKKYDCPVMYLDNDCILMEPVDELFEYDFDVAVVYRYKWEAHGGRQDCLGGFLYFSQKRPEVEDIFLEKLIKKTQKWYSKEIESGSKPWYYDQLAINDLVGSPPIERTKDEYEFALPYSPCIKDVEGVKVLFLSANEWACPMSVNLTEKVRIIHYNHANWPTRYIKDANGVPFFRGKIQPAQEVPAL